MKPWQLMIVGASLVVGLLTAAKAYARMDALLAVNAALLIANGILWTTRWRKGS